MTSLPRLLLAAMAVAAAVTVSPSLPRALYTNDFPMLARVSTVHNSAFTYNCTGVLVGSQYVIADTMCFRNYANTSTARDSDVTGTSILVDVGYESGENNVATYYPIANQTLGAGSGKSPAGSLMLMELDRPFSDAVVVKAVESLKFADSGNFADNQTLVVVERYPDPSVSATTNSAKPRFNTSEAAIISDGECKGLMEATDIQGGVSRKDGSLMCTKRNAVAPCSNYLFQGFDGAMLIQPLESSSSSSSSSLSPFAIVGMRVGYTCDGTYEYHVWTQFMRYSKSIADGIHVDRDTLLPPSMVKTSRLSPGAIAGIVVGGTLVVGLLVLAAVYVRRTRNANNRLAVDQAIAIKDLGEQLARIEQPVATEADYYGYGEAPVYFVPVTSEAGELVALGAHIPPAEHGNASKNANLVFQQPASFNPATTA